MLSKRTLRLYTIYPYKAYPTLIYDISVQSVPNAYIWYIRTKRTLRLYMIYSYKAYPTLWRRSQPTPSTWCRIYGQFNSFYPRYAYIRTSDHGFRRSGTHISVPAIMAFADQVRIYPYQRSWLLPIRYGYIRTQLLTTLWLFLFGAKACALTTVSYNHFLNVSAQRCSHVLAIFNRFWYTRDFEWTAAEQLV